MRKTRANWSLPKLQQSMQTTGGGFKEEPKDDLPEVPKFKKLRMVTHFMKPSKFETRPPLPNKNESRNNNPLVNKLSRGQDTAQASPKISPKGKFPEI